MNGYRRVLILASCGLLLASACGKKEKASCAAAASHVANLLRSEVAKNRDPERLKQARANAPTLQNALLVACQKQEWNPKTRQCIISAATAAQTTECQPEPASAKPRPASAKPAPNPKP